MFKRGEQLEFGDSEVNREDKKEVASEKTETFKANLEKDDCQYCQDGGPCMYCERGKEFVAQMKKNNKN